MSVVHNIQSKSLTHRYDTALMRRLDMSPQPQHPSLVTAMLHVKVDGDASPSIGETLERHTVFLKSFQTKNLTLMNSQIVFGHLRTIVYA